MKRFNISVGKNVEDYYSVVIFKTKKQMEQFFGVGKCEAITNSFTIATMKNGEISKLPISGVIGFYEDKITPATVSHEMIHALNHYWKNKKVKFNLGKVNKDWFEKDELYATVLGYMVNEFWRQHEGKFEKVGY